MPILLYEDCKKRCGPGYKSPLDAYENGKRETILYTICIQPNPQIKNKPDYLAIVDVDPDSPTYSKVPITMICRTFCIFFFCYTPIEFWKQIKFRKQKYSVQHVTVPRRLFFGPAWKKSATNFIISDGTLAAVVTTTAQKAETKWFCPP